MRHHTGGSYIGSLMKKCLRLIMGLCGLLLVSGGCDAPNAGLDDPLPILSEPVTTFNDQTDIFYAAVLLTLEDGASLDSIWTEMYLESGELADSLGTDTLMAAVGLLDDASGGDILSGDDVYGASFASPLPAGSGGMVRFLFVAQVTAIPDSLSTTLSLMNLRPVILSVTAADTMILPTNGFNLDTIRVIADDPDGLDDIRQVSFTSLKPDSTLANSGLPIVLFDNGDLTGWGDVTANDGIFSRIVPLSPGDSTGTYIYKFVAADFAGAVSDTVSHSVEVTP